MTTLGGVAVFQCCSTKGCDVCRFLILAHCNALVEINAWFSVRQNYGVSTKEYCVDKVVEMFNLRKNNSKSSSNSSCVILELVNFNTGAVEEELAVCWGRGTVGRTIRADTWCFCRGTSVLTHLSNSGYGLGLHKQPNLAARQLELLLERHAGGAQGESGSRVTPLFSRLLSYQPQRSSTQQWLRPGGRDGYWSWGRGGPRW